MLKIMIIDDVVPRANLYKMLKMADTLLVKRDPHIELVIEVPTVLMELTIKRRKRDHLDPTHPRNAFKRR